MLRTAKREAGCEVSEAPSQLYVRLSEMQRKKGGLEERRGGTGKDDVALFNSQPPTAETAKAPMGNAEQMVWCQLLMLEGNR